MMNLPPMIRREPLLNNLFLFNFDFFLFAKLAFKLSNERESNFDLFFLILADSSETRFKN